VLPQEPWSVLIFFGFRNSSLSGARGGGARGGGARAGAMAPRPPGCVEPRPCARLLNEAPGGCCNFILKCARSASRRFATGFYGSRGVWGAPQAAPVLRGPRCRLLLLPRRARSACYLLGLRCPLLCSLFMATAACFSTARCTGVPIALVCPLHWCAHCTGVSCTCLISASPWVSSLTLPMALLMVSRPSCCSYA
jgi:hypothetical protein